MLTLPSYFDHKPFDKFWNKNKERCLLLKHNLQVRLNVQLSLTNIYFRAVNIMFCIYFYLILHIALTIYKEQMLKVRTAEYNSLVA